MSSVRKPESLPLTLALDGSTEKLFLALLENEACRAELSLDCARPHSETMMNAIRELLQLAGVELAMLRRLAVGYGPGSFSSLRISLATMQGLSQALEIPLYGFVGLDLLALPLTCQPLPIVALSDARRRQVYWAQYETVDGRLMRTTPYRVDDPATVVTTLTKRRVLLAGGGAALYREELESLLPQAGFVGLPFASLSPGMLRCLAWEDAPTVSYPTRDNSFPVVFRLSESVSPLYIRPSDAELKQAG
jgi:tRNA threonylcarbamoyl adenosine modification protein YeaZ